MLNVKLLFLFLCYLSINLCSQAQNQCQENTEEKILLVGDSWAFFMDFDDTFNQVLPTWGHTNKTYYTNSILAENGATLTDFLQPEKLDEIELQLQQKPSIDVVHLSLGGNDFLQNWNIDFTDQETDDLKNSVINNLITLINHIKSYRPNIQILWSGYTYTNFEEIISTSFIPALHPFNNTWASMGFPDNESLNLILNDFSNSIIDLSETDTQLDFVNATGLMQHIFGQETNLAVAPFGSYPPLDAPLPIGFINYPSPQISMRNYSAFIDCFHLSAAGYAAFINYQTQKYYHKVLMDDSFFITENNNLSGSLTETSTLNDLFVIGDFNNTEHKLILNFPTENQLDFNTAEAELFVRIKEEANITENLSFLVEVKSGFFGSTESIEADDFTFVADASSEVCYFGDADEEKWLRLSLNDSLLASINNQNQTQIRISLTEDSSGYIQFFDASDEDFAPVLNITYGDEPSLSTSFETAKNFSVYPNPTSSKIYFDFLEGNLEGLQIKVFNLNGVEMKPVVHKNAIDISEFPNGTYILRLTHSESSMHTKIIKR